MAHLHYFPAGAVLGAVVGAVLLLVLALGGRRARAPWVWLYLVGAAIAVGLAVPAVILANYEDNTHSPTPMWMSALVFAGPMLLAGAMALSPTWPRVRRIVLGSIGAALIVAGEIMVANDAGSCIDDDCLGLPPALVVLTYLAPWVAGALLLAAVHPLGDRPSGDDGPAPAPAPVRQRPAHRRAARLVAAGLAGAAFVLAFWPVGVSGEYRVPTGYGISSTWVELNQCGLPVVDAFVSEDSARLGLPDGGLSYGTVSCRPAAETRMTAAFLVFGLAVILGVWGAATDPTAARVGDRPTPRTMVGG